jgi:hypothetical protein
MKMNIYLEFDKKCNEHTCKDYSSYEGEYWWYDLKLAICPFCNFKWTSGFEYTPDDPGSMIDYGEYVTIPMLQCNNCSAHSFIDAPAEHGYADEDGTIYISKYQKSGDGYLFPLIKVQRVIDNNMLEYITDTKLTDEQVIELMKCNYNTELLNKYNITKLRPSDSIEDIVLDTNNFNISLPCNSYNVEQPEIPYPKEFDPSHGGIYIKVLLEGDRIAYYWGD